MKKHPTNSLEVTYTFAHPADEGSIEQEVDRAFDILFEATLTAEAMMEESIEETKESTHIVSPNAQLTPSRDPQ